jgi:hypothetical protein
MTYSILAEGLVKRFGDTVALDGIDLAVRTGSVFGLLGWLAVTSWPGCRASMISSARSLAPATSTISPGSPSVRTSSDPSIATCTGSIVPD